MYPNITHRKLGKERFLTIYKTPSVTRTWVQNKIKLSLICFKIIGKVITEIENDIVVTFCL